MNTSTAQGSEEDTIPITTVTRCCDYWGFAFVRDMPVRFYQGSDDERAYGRAVLRATIPESYPGGHSEGCQNLTGQGPIRELSDNELRAPVGAERDPQRARWWPDLVAQYNSSGGNASGSVQR